jgi:hypothetical protein
MIPIAIRFPISNRKLWAHFFDIWKNCSHVEKKSERSFAMLCFRASKKQNIAISICHFKPTQPIVIIPDGLTKYYAT